VSNRLTRALLRTLSRDLPGTEPEADDRHEHGPFWLTVVAILVWVLLFALLVVVTGLRMLISE
jgi:hypothetical protein